MASSGECSSASSSSQARSTSSISRFSIWLDQRGRSSLKDQAGRLQADPAGRPPTARHFPRERRPEATPRQSARPSASSAPGRRGDARLPPIVLARLGPLKIRAAIRFAPGRAVEVALVLCLAGAEAIVCPLGMRDADRALGAFAIGPAIGDAAIAALERVEARELDLFRADERDRTIARARAFRGDADAIGFGCIIPAPHSERSEREQNKGVELFHHGSTSVVAFIPKDERIY